MDAREFLGLERVGDDRWAFTVSERLITPGHFLYGGAGLAAGLAALEEATGRPTVWGTAQYVSHAPTGARVELAVEPLAVGGRITQARATATSEGRTVLTVAAALGTGELTSPAPWAAMPEVPRPEECAARHRPPAWGANLFAHLESRIARGR
ncbi:MAG TPA: acyl-CoA thioesterase domain-containing protein, partial [Acidimicrobiales bacterium]|nr:acyl-CoA thioesterase domain-containing protein [Acidimicrobiales bacterium]